jgi:hypothetical protein
MKEFVRHLSVILLMWQAYSYLHIRNKQFPWGMVSRPFSLETDFPLEYVEIAQVADDLCAR